MQTHSLCQLGLSAQVDAHLASHISSLKLHQADILAAPSATSQISLPQHSRFSALNLPLTLPPLPESDDTSSAQPGGVKGEFLYN